MQRVLVALLALSLVTVTAGCGRRRVVTAPPPAQSQVLTSGGGAPMAGPVLVLGTDLFCTIRGSQMQVLANGQLWVDGTFVGTFTPDGGFYNVDGVEIGRLFDNGRMTFAGTMQDAGIEGNQLIAPRGTIAYIDANGWLVVVGGAAPMPVGGLHSGNVRTFLFAFSMYVALLDTAQRMGL
jgi:hypothetical protein